MKHLAVVLVLAGFAPLAHAVVCPATEPICQASPGTGVCQLESSRACLLTSDCFPSGGNCMGGPLAIGGKVTPTSASIVSVTLSGASNLTLVAGAPGSPTYFRVFPTNPSADATGVVVGTDSGTQTCRVPVNFKIRSAGAIVPASPETVCPFAENYSFAVTSAPSSPAGTTACSSHLATCLDTAPSRPGGYDYASDARVFGIKSPIAGFPVDMEMVRGGAFLADLKLLFSRSLDGGFTFSNFTDNTTAVEPGSTRIRGTGQWSDVKVVAGMIVLSAVPTLGEWAIVILSLLLLASSTLLFTNRRTALAHGGSIGAAMLDRRLMLRVSGAAGVVWLLGVLTLTAVQGAPSTTDIIGSLITAAILAYQAQLWILQGRR